MQAPVKVLLRLFKLGCVSFLVLAALALYLLYLAVMPADPEGTRGAVVLEVPQGASAGQIARLLEEQKVVPSAFAFRLLVRYGGHGSAIRAGRYKLKPSDPPLRILEHLVRGDTLQRRVTFPEGLTVEGVAEILGREKVCSASEFLRLVRTKGRDFGDLFPANLEGYLFPDTYDFPWECSAREAARIMTGRFQEVVVPLWSSKAPLSLARSVILASLVEREAQVPSERPLIAGVYLNRLEDGMLLQCDATIQYALGRPKAVLTHRDLELDSPYNSYKHPGLPPGPICCPGQAALQAAMQPKKSDYLFYVRNDVKADGSHVFSRTFTEHQRAINQYQR